jgi:hypothetical protein
LCVGDAVVVVIVVGAAVFVLEVIKVLRLIRALVGRADDAVPIGIFLGAAVVVVDAVDRLGLVRALVEVIRDAVAIGVDLGLDPDDRRRLFVRTHALRRELESSRRGRAALRASTSRCLRARHDACHNSTISCQRSETGIATPGPQYTTGSVSFAMNGDDDAIVAPPAPATSCGSAAEPRIRSRAWPRQPNTGAKYDILPPPDPPPVNAGANASSASAASCSVNASRVHSDGNAGSRGARRRRAPSPESAPLPTLPSWMLSPKYSVPTESRSLRSGSLDATPDQATHANPSATPLRTLS